MVGPGRAGPVCRLRDGGGGEEAPISTPARGARRWSTPPRASASPADGEEEMEPATEAAFAKFARRVECESQDSS